MKKNKYAQIPERIVDLHGLTVDEAEHALSQLVNEFSEMQIRVIIGKGIHSPHGPVLPNFVKNYLTNRGIPFRQSKLHEGGEGALEVFF